MKIPIGVYDSPLTQTQPIFMLDYWKTNIAVFGGPMSGKSCFIKNFLVRVSESLESTNYRENIYIIDFGGGLGDYGRLPVVCACFNNRNEENIKRIFKTIEKELEIKQKFLTNQNFIEFINSNKVGTLPHTTLVIDNINSFFADERYSSYQELLIQLCRDGISKGFSVIVTGTESSGLSRLMSSFGQKIAYDMPSESYYDIFGKKVYKPLSIPGRCLVNIGSEVLECQTFMPFKDNESYELDSLVKTSATYIKHSKLKAFPEILDSNNINQYCAKLNEIDVTNAVLGLDYYKHTPISIDFTINRSIGIYGKRQFGKSNALRILINKLKENPLYKFVYLDDGRRGLEEYKSYSLNDAYFTDNLEFFQFLHDKGYCKYKEGPFTERSNPFTVFVIQNKSFFASSNTPHIRQLILRICDMISKAEEKQYIFIFSDVRKITDADVRSNFNNSLSVAILLDNIGDFVSDKGSTSVFGEMDSRELKAEYAKCSIGDGYYYDIMADSLSKLKFIKTEELGDKNGN